ncbi:inositol monophosphatase [Motilibacter sp. E257]|uniref:Inositol-1-monophosphatase n=1 Tax=Motilibacter deserti TaxID=2714956 RepID=A0ABX0GW20_9ACTN|nr:inositol monophosphatase [Motilibacter deserti]
MPDLQELLSVATEAAARAARLLVDERPPDLGVAATKSSPTDPVTEMDRASERLVVETVLARRPGDGFFGEEGADRAGTSGVVWVIDPIDGTVNYLYDHPFWAVSVAAEVEGEAVVGVVAAPAVGETFWAVRGGGAHLSSDAGSRPLQVNSGVALDRALVGTGFGYAAERRARQGAVVAQLLPRVRDIRRGGSAAYDLCSLAAGRLDAYYERGVQRWDTAAGALVAREAGAVVGGVRGAAASPELTVAAAPGLFDDLAALLAELGADRD